MVRLVSIILLYSLCTGDVFGQEQNNIQSFQDVISYINQYTEYSYSYPPGIGEVPLYITNLEDINEPRQLKKLLRPFGIHLITKDKLLIFSIEQIKTQVSGYVKDQETGESLIGAHIIDVSSKKGVTTNPYGFFSISVTGDSLAVSYIGYKPKLVDLSNQQGSLQIGLSASSNLLEEIIVSDIQEVQEINQMSSIKLNAAQVKKMPVFMGEADILKSIQLLPGVQSGTEGTSGLYVRGGGPDQNLILLDGVPVYNANHLFGFFSVFNSDAIQNVTLIKGGFPARYGGRLSSVIDIQMKEGNTQEFQAEGSVGLIASKLTISGPLKKGKTSFMLSGRRTYIDLFTVPLARAANSRRVVGYNFSDLNGKINHKFSEKDRLFVSFYTGNDRFFDEYKFENTPTFSEKETGRINWGNITGTLRWNHVFNNRLFSNSSLIFSRYQFKLNTTIDYQYESPNTSDIFRENDYFSNIRDFGLKTDFDYYQGNDHHVRFGLNATHHTLNPGISRFRSHVETDTTFGSTKDELIEMASYIEDEMAIDGNTSINLGVHFSVAQNQTTYQSIQPRISINQQISSSLSIKASYSRMAQYIHLLVNSGVGLPTDLWVPSTKRVKPQFSDQVALGLATSARGLSITLEGYYKWMDNLIEYKDGAGFLDIDNDWEDKVEFGSGDSYGIEFFVQKQTGRHTGWLGYTWSKSNRDFENLNFGRTFPYRYDRRHDLSLLYQLAISERIQFGAVWVFSTGNSITLPTSSFPKASWSASGPDYEGFIKSFPGRNSSRTKDYHRIDLNISFTKVKKWGEQTWVFGLYNAYSRLNPNFVEFDDSVPTNKQFKQLSLFPILPNVSYQFKF